jgi:hypothetical protein
MYQLPKGSKERFKLFLIIIVLVTSLSVGVYFLVTSTNPALESSRLSPRGGLIIPLYKYPVPSDPEDVWKTVGHTKNIPIQVILNPNNGDDADSSPNSDWQYAINQVKTHTTLGYIYTSYGQRNMVEIKALIDGYVRNDWGVNGFFFDETSSMSHHSYYQQIHNYVKANYSQLLVVFNPGTPVDLQMFQIPDITMNFESPKTTFDAFVKPKYQTPEVRTQVQGIVLDVSNSNEAIIEMQKMQDLNFFWKYILHNQSYVGLPPYYSNLVQWIAEKI